MASEEFPSEFQFEERKTLLERLKSLAPYERRRILLGVVVIILLIAVVFLSGGRDSNGPAGPPQRANLYFWDVFDDEEIYKPLITAYRQRNPGVNIFYVQKNDFDKYQGELTSAFADGSGPDIYSIHNTWLPLEINRTVPLNDTLEAGIATDPIIAKYPDVVRFDFTREDKTTGESLIYALPLAIDTLGLYYNQTYFNSENLIDPPRTWEEFTSYIKKLRRIGSDGEVQLAGAIMGSALNINRSTDILSLLMLQTGTAMNDEFLRFANFSRSVRDDDGVFFYPSREAMEFYTSFADPTSENYTWDGGGSYSIDSFVQGDAAMMINYSFHRDTIRRKSPNLNFTVAPIPQPSDRFDRVNYANYWGLTVSEHSENQKVAWDFINFLTSESAAKIYLENSGRPPALKSLIADYADDKEMSVYANQILSAKSWIQGDPEVTEDALAEAIESVLDGSKRVDRALNDAQSKINIILRDLTN